MIRYTDWKIDTTFKRFFFFFCFSSTLDFEIPEEPYTWAFIGFKDQQAYNVYYYSKQNLTSLNERQKFPSLV